MEDRRANSISVTRFVVAFMIVKLAIGACFALYFFATNKDPEVSSAPINILAVGVAMHWYTKLANRPMSSAEIIKFSGGNVVADIVLSAVWGVSMIWLLGLPFNWNGVGAVLGGADSHNVKLALVIGLAIGSVQVFLLSALLAWSFSRKLPRGKLPEAGADDRRRSG